MTNLTCERLRGVLHYDSATGVFTRINGSGGTKAGDVAGSVALNGYLTIRVDRCLYYAHRLAWFYVHGNWPAQMIDHINCDRADNRITNLRLSDAKHNGQNRRRARPNSTCDLLGVSWVTGKQKWRAQIGVDRNTRHIGYFNDPQEAHEAYIAEKRRIHAGCTI